MCRVHILHHAGKLNNEFKLYRCWKGTNCSIFSPLCKSKTFSTHLIMAKQERKEFLDMLEVIEIRVHMLMIVIVL